MSTSLRLQQFSATTAQRLDVAAAPLTAVLPRKTALQPEVALPPIFVTGTGRSGTWILYKSLGAHPDVHTFPREMRFLIDPDGLRDLTYALSSGFHPAQAREALYRFERLMRVSLAEPAHLPYRGFDLPATIGAPYYWQRLDAFISQLYDAQYDGRVWHLDPQNEGRLVAAVRKLRTLMGRPRGALPRDHLKVARYFDRPQLAALAAAFVDDLFRHAAHNAGKQTWAEKTPQHLLCLDFIWELFPDAAVIHIKRDPRGVVHSLTKQPWAPSDPAAAAWWLRRVYERWFALQETLDLSAHRYLELKLEDLADTPRDGLACILDFCGLSNSLQEAPAIVPQRVNYWQEVLSAAGRRSIEEILGPAISRMGYEL